MVVCVRVFPHHYNFLTGRFEDGVGEGRRIICFFFLKELTSCYIILVSVDLLPMIMKKLRTHSTYLWGDADL